MKPDKPIYAEPNKFTVARLDGFLDAFALINNKTNYSYTFTFESLKKMGDLNRTLENYFRGQASDIQAIQIEPWEQVVQDVLKQWLFEFQNQDEDHLEDSKLSFSLSHEAFRQTMLHTFTQQISSTFNLVAVWRVEITPIVFYECSWVDIVFEETERITLLHFGVSD